MFIKDCNTCWCNEDGTSYFCTRRVCVEELPDETEDKVEVESILHGFWFLKELAVFKIYISLFFHTVIIPRNIFKVASIMKKYSTVYTS